MSENQKSVTEWCDEHYPGQDVAKRVRDVFEEATELAAALGVNTLTELLDVVTKSWEKSRDDFGKASEVPGEFGDLQIATLWLASATGHVATETLDDKMAINRQKTVAASQARLARKGEIFKGPSS